MGTSKRLAPFDGLRACAALSVLAYHVGLANGASRHGALAPLFSQLKGGVVIFFVISGALLYMPYARTLRSGAQLRDWRDYARRRAARILPAYWVVLTVVALMPFGAGVLTANGWRYYALAQIYSGLTLSGGLTVAWTLCVEVTFYALLPVLAAGLARVVATRSERRVRMQLFVIAALGAVSLLIRVSVAGSPFTAVSSAHAELVTALPGMLDWFALGMGLAVLAVEWQAGERSAPAIEALARRPAVCWVAAGVCWLAAAAAQPSDMFLPITNLASHLALGVASALLVLPALHPQAGEQETGPMRLMRRAPLAWLGTVSYGLYLWHMPVILGLRGAPLPTVTTVSWPGLVVLLAEVSLLTVGLAALSWYSIERPALRRAAQRRQSPRCTGVLAVEQRPT